MYCKLNNLLYIILLFINIKSLKTFNVNFNYNFNLRVEPFNTQIYKRELMQFFDKALFSFNGFEKVESIPVLFPIDICVFSLEDSKYATTLHMKRNGTRHFAVFKKSNGFYELIADIPTPNGVAMDCTNFNNKGYVAIAFQLIEPIQYAKEGSPIYEIVGNSIRAVQYFAAPNLTSVYLRASGNDLFLLHAYANSEDTPNLYCPFFKWSGNTFNKIGRIPCSNARQLTPFSMDYESYVAVANYADQNGHTSTNSEIYKYSSDKNKFMLFQKIPTNGAVDVEYFNIPQNEARKHFLIFGNSKSRDPFAKGDGDNLDADSVIYLFDKGQFIPYQKLSFYAVKKFLPLQNVEAEKFILLVACTDQDIKIYNFNDWKFEESQVQFTEGALGKGVSNMRIYQEHEKTYLIIANSLMADNETNIFLPIFKQEEHANALRQKIIDWAKAEIQRLETVNTKELGKRLEEKLKNLEQMKYLPSMQDIPKANIQTVTTEALIYPKLHMTTDYWLALSFINKAVDSLEIMLKQRQRLKRDAVSTPKAYENVEYDFDTLNVKTLTVNKELKAKTVNRVSSVEPQLESIKAQRVVVNNSFIKPSQERVISWENMDYVDAIDVMAFKDLKINGRLNGYQMSDLFNNTLKRKEETQFLKAPIAIEILKTDTIVVSKDKVNDQDLGALIPISGGKHVINQIIQFASPIIANQLHILERLNNIHVFNGQFDVLLKKCNKTQAIEGVKNVTTIKVLEPMVTANKMRSSPLETISPIKFIHEPLLLQGNFMINGDVEINHQLNTLDLIDLNEKLSMKQVLDMGLRMDIRLKDVNLKFQQQLIANNSLVNFANQHDLQRLVQLNNDDIQVIEGLKVFNDTVEIRSGFSEVKNLNGINIGDLENNVFLRNNNQTIKVSMKIGNISAQSIESPTILLNTKNLSEYLTLTGNQSIEGSLILDNLTAQFLTVEHLNTDSKIFRQSLQDIYQQKSRNAPQEDVLKQNRKFHGSIYVQNLVLNSTINNKPVDEIENQILQLEGNIKYVGNFKFNYPINITNMTFHGKLNGIQAEDFGKYWLQKNAEKQIFTAAQTLATLNAEGGIFLEGKLNGLTMDEFYTRTYWISRNENIQCMEFENPIEITTYLNTKTLNNYMVPHDVFFKNFKESHIFLKSMTVKQNLKVEGRILNLTSIDNINLRSLQGFLDSPTKPTLYVDSAYFLQSPPMYKTLNSHNIRKTLDSIWLTNDNVVLPHEVEIADANFEGLLEFEGSINNVNLDFLKENYFSRTKAQDISTEIAFSEDVEIEEEIYLNDLHVFGNIEERKSNHSFKFNEFARSTLKTSGPHIISGNWNLFDIKVEGSLNDVLINDLNLWNDIILKGNPANIYELTAPKIFKTVHIDNLYADSTSLVNTIQIANLVKDAVYLYENYTIKGVSTINSLNIYNNLFVFGNLNNVTFNEHNLLLTNKKQTLPGSTKIVSYLAKEKRFLTNNIENLYAGYINGQFIPKFMENLIPAARNAEIESNLSFKSVLKIEMYNGPEGFLVKRNIDKETPLKGQNFDRTHDVMEKFEEVESNLNKIKQNIVCKLNHFDVVQTISLKSSELLTLSVKLDNLLVDILVISDMQDKNVTVFKWIPTEKQFRKTKEFNWLPYDPLSLKIIQKKFLSHHQSVEVTTLKTFISHDLKIFHGLLTEANNRHNYFEFSNPNCIHYQKQQQTFLEINHFCSDTKSRQNIINSTGNVQQIQAMGQNSIAVLANSSILLYEMNSNSSKLVQKLTVTEPQQMALGSFKDFKFIAILSRGKSNSLSHGRVEIYRSSNSSAFTFLQSLKCSEPTQVTFSVIENSSDFLIHILSDSFNKPYLIYQYQGVIGFKEILSDSMLPANFFGFDIFNLYSNKYHLVALKAQENITMIELVFNQV